MAKTFHNLTLTLTASELEQLTASAEAAKRLPAEHAIALIFDRLDWPDLAEAAAQIAQVNEIVAERDRARDSAVLHEADAHGVREQLIEMVGTGEIVVSPGFFAKVGCEVPRTYLSKGSRR